MGAPVTALKIHHTTSYRFRQPVSLSPHRLMLRPRETRDLRVIPSNITVTPAATLTWAHDVLGNVVATATFQMMSDSLLIDSAVELELDAVAWPIFDIAASAISYPFRYSDDEWIDLGSLSIPQHARSAAHNKGMVLFPRKIDGRYAMVARQNNENLYLIYSDDLYSWEGGRTLLQPEPKG
jgi:transglutaminase-like putative cysteine protease